MDKRMTKLYLDARWVARKDMPASEALRDAQRAWMAERNGCRSLACIARTYDRRIRLLMERADAHLVMPRALEESGAHWTIAIHYPELDLPPPAGEVANRVVSAWVEGQITDFREQIQAVTAGPGSEAGSTPPWPGADWSLDLEYGAVHQAERFIAIPFSGYVYTGGAHGMPIGAYLVLDRESGEPIPPAGLFAPESDWLTFLSRRASEVLRERDLLTTDRDWLDRGTAPDPINYQLLYPGPDGLTITFLPYWVAPYAAGIQEVLIPYADLDGLLNPRLFPR
jgi:hypothetical protein